MHCVVLARVWKRVSIFLFFCRKNKDDFLRNLARDNTQLLFNAIWKVQSIPSIVNHTLGNLTQLSLLIQANQIPNCVGLIFKPIELSQRNWTQTRSVLVSRTWKECFILKFCKSSLDKLVAHFPHQFYKNQEFGNQTLDWFCWSN